MFSVQQKMQNRSLSCFIILLAYVIGNVQGKKRIYCSPYKHMFYIPVGDLCKKCDKCNPGWGLEPAENAKFEISEHGALGCRKCKICDDGYFNRWRSYDGCKRCKDCEALGRSIKYRCTRTRNTKCGKKLRVSTVSTLTKNGTMSTTTPRHNVSPSTPFVRLEPSGIKSIFAHNKIVFSLLGSTIGLLALFIGIVFYLYYINCRHKRSKGKEPNGMTKGKDNEANINENDVEADGEIELESYPCLGDASTCNNTASAFTVKDEELTAKQLMFVAKRIAPKEGYRELGLELNVEEHDIAIIEEENPRCCKNRSFKVLKKWTEMFPDKAFVTELLTTLGRIGRHDVMRDFYREYSDILIDKFKWAEE